MTMVGIQRTMVDDVLKYIKDHDVTLSVAPQFELLFRVEHSLGLDMSEHSSYCDDLMCGADSRFMRWAKALHIHIFPSNVDDVKIRRLSYTQDKCMRLFNNQPDKCTALVINVPDYLGRIWKKLTRPGTKSICLGVNDIVLAIQACRISEPNTTRITLSQNVFCLLEKYINELPPESVVYIAEDKTYWMPCREYKEYVLAASKEGWVRYTPLNKESERRIWGHKEQKSSLFPVTCSTDSMDRIKELLSDQSLDHLPEVSDITSNDAYVVGGEIVEVSEAHSVCMNVEASDDRVIAEWIPYLENDMPLCM